MTTILENIKTGMRVFDQADNEIGTVDYVKLSDEDPTQPGVETRTVHPIQQDSNDSLVGNMLEVFSPDDIPEELRERLLREGFVRVESDGLFHADRYILPNQIHSVNEGEVRLNVMKAALIKRS
jgi:hypothetical protein